MESYDVVVIGAGISGLSAARKIVQNSPDLKVLLLEAKNRVGGRTETVTLQTEAGSDQWDLGGQWVGTTQNHLRTLLSELGLNIYNQHTEGKKLYQLGSPKIRTYNSIWTVNPFWAVDVALFMSRVQALANKMRLVDPFGWAGAGALDAISLELYAQRTCWTDALLDGLEILARTVFGTTASKISMLYLLLFGKAAGSIPDLLETEDTGAQRYRIQNGAQQICKLMSRDLPEGSELRLNTAVVRIVQNDTNITVLTISTDSTNTMVEYGCRRAILAVPPQEAAKIRFEPVLSHRKHQILHGFPQGNLLKVIITYSTPFWRQLGYSGEIISAGRSSEKKERHPIMVAFDATTSHGNAAILLFLHLEWADKSREERKMATFQDLARFLGPEAYDHVDYAEKIWSEEPYNGGCPIGVVPVGNMESWTAIREPHIKIHWAGTEAATEWPGYMSGAVQSGWRAANEVLYELAPDSVTDADFDAGSVYSRSYMTPHGKTAQFSKSRNLTIAFGLGICALVGIGFMKKYGVQVPLDFWKP